MALILLPPKRGACYELALMKKIFGGLLVAGSLMLSFFAFAGDRPDAAKETTRLADAYVKGYLERFPERAAFSGMTLPQQRPLLR